MEGPVVLVDTCVLIDYFRRKDKGRTLLAEDGCTGGEGVRDQTIRK